jgi:hypothetical protein
MDGRTNAIIVAFKTDQAAAEALAAQYPGGAGSFGPGCSKWHTVAGTPVPDCTQVAVSGTMDSDMVEAFRMNSVPKFQVIDNPDDHSPASMLVQCQPPLYPGVDTEVV